MANELLNTLKYIQNYVDGIDAGVNKFIDVVPLLVQQHVSALAKGKLNTTYDDYMSALTTKVENNVLIVELDKDNWIANAVENGANAFDMKAGLLASPKAKTGKNGKKFIVIPIGKDKNSKGGTTQKGQDLQKKIQEVLLKPKFGPAKVKLNPGGGVWETQKIETDDADLQGFYRSRSFDSVADAHSGKKKPKWNLVLFRVVSENSKPDSFLHPGITPNNFLKSTDTWLDNTGGQILDSFIAAELVARKIT